jgi:polyhydroxybutyrate depolymerase
MKYYLTFVILVFLMPGKIVKSQNKIVFGQSTHQILVDHIPRNSIIYLPKAYSTAKKLPAIFLFHGGGGRADFILKTSTGRDFKSISERNNIILIAPDGIKKSWNDGRQTKSNKMNIDDIKFINLLLQYITTNYSVDNSRIYATGISNGGFMVSRLGCEIGYRFAAIAVVAATMGVDTPYSACRPDFSLPVMYIHGTADPVIPFNGAQKSIGAKGAFVSHQQVIDKWVCINQCNSIPVMSQLPDISDDQTTITKSEYDGGKDGAKVIGYVVHNGGHTWPGGKRHLPKFLVGNVSMDMNACEVIWDFFNENKKQLRVTAATDLK